MNAAQRWAVCDAGKSEGQGGAREGGLLRMRSMHSGCVWLGDDDGDGGDGGGDGDDDDDEGKGEDNDDDDGG